MSKGTQTRQTILKQAMNMAAMMGLEGVTIGRLADSLKLSKSGLFAHFQSKEALQVQILSMSAEVFTDRVIRPAINEKAGLTRVRALFDHWLRWTDSQGPGGCVFFAAAVELDDRPGQVRDHLVSLQSQWVQTIRKIIQTAVGSGELQAQTDVKQLAFELHGVLLSHHFYSRLLGDSHAEERTRHAFENLIAKNLKDQNKEVI